MLPHFSPSSIRGHATVTFTTLRQSRSEPYPDRYLLPDISLQPLHLSPNRRRRYGIACRSGNRQCLCFECFEQEAISSAIKKPAHWYRYVNDIFTVGTHGKKELTSFLQHPNSIHLNIKFRTEVKHNNMSPFVDVLVSSRTHCILGTQPHGPPPSSEF
jgi:hypothetical protein